MNRLILILEIKKRRREREKEREKGKGGEGEKGRKKITEVKEERMEGRENKAKIK